MGAYRKADERPRRRTRDARPEVNYTATMVCGELIEQSVPAADEVMAGQVSNCLMLDPTRSRLRR
jgi:hypothetical protein